MKTSAATIDKTIYFVTPIVLQQLIALQLCKASTASNENCVELNVILHQKSKFPNTGCSKRNSALSTFISIHHNIMMSQYRVPW